MSTPDDKTQRTTDLTGMDAVPGVARVAASAYLRAAGWGLRASVDVNRRLLRAAFSPKEAVSLLQDVEKVTRQVAGAIVDVASATENPGTATNGDRPATPQRSTTAAAATSAATRTAASAAQAASSAITSATNAAARVTAIQEPGQMTAELAALSDRGAALMRQSRDVRYEEDAHPAYERILEELAPDEGRILRLLLLGGPQPSVDVRTGGPLSLVTSGELIAPGLSMIGARAGCRYVDRVPAYLNNLFRLGLIWFSRETLRDVHRYQVIEAQPDVLEAMHSTRFPKLVRRSIHLTPFGEDFCRHGLGLAREDTGDLPVHAMPHGDIPGPPAPEL